MLNLVPTNPFSEFVRWNPFREFEDVFGPRSMRAYLPEEPSFKMNVSETPEWYRVKAALPGVTKDDIHVRIDGNVVTISADTKYEGKEPPTETTLCTEYYFGKQSRTFTFRHDIDDMKATARYVDGVLDLMLPKKAATAAKELAVH